MELFVDLTVVILAHIIWKLFLYKSKLSQSLDKIKKWIIGLTLNDMQKAMGAHSFLSTESIFGTWTSRMSKGPDPD